MAPPPTSEFLKLALMIVVVIFLIAFARRVLSWLVGTNETTRAIKELEVVLRQFAALSGVTLPEKVSKEKPLDRVKRLTGSLGAALRARSGSKF